jgi:acetylornithine deacetylase
MEPAGPIDPVALTRSLVDIDSTTGREAEAGRWLAEFLRGRGYHVTEQPVTNGRINVLAQLDAPPAVAFSTHFDCVPPFFPSREERGLVFGRGACDAKGIVAAQIAAAERLRAAGERRFALLFVVGEERGSDGAKQANEIAPPGVRFLINGEPTDNRLGAATRGIVRVRLRASGRAAHSSFPELGESAIDKLLDALMVVRGLEWPDDPVLGRTHYTVGLIEGGVAPKRGAERGVAARVRRADVPHRRHQRAGSCRAARDREPGPRRAHSRRSCRTDARGARL